MRCVYASHGSLDSLENEKVAIMEMRKYASWYLKGLKGNNRIRNRINQAETRETMLNILYAL